MAIVTRPYKARGANVKRCRYCMVNSHLCICDLKPKIDTQAAFMLIMYDDEILKPSNTGRLIADLAPDTTGYIWSRLAPNEAMLAQLKNPKYQPYVVFPGEYATQQQVVCKPSIQQGKTPLFVLLDGSWSQARKMFKKSRWLHQYPVLSFAPDTVSRYKIRESALDNQLATAEVAALVYASLGEAKNAMTMDLWFDVFKEHYLTGKMQRQLPEQGARYALAQWQNTNATATS
ncbi:tRNA-uridine aminocarboxypropyltransferase [Motilimonas pumila]|nr:DTW domain-containing protein [Motilimonas pumila]